MSEFRSGFTALVGRPNVGKSTLLNHILGTKVSITSDKVQTTRRPVRGVLDGDGWQLVFVDTPGIHKPVTALGRRLNDHAAGSAADADVLCLVVDARSGIGRGDAFVAATLPSDTIVVLNKVDGLPRGRVLEQLDLACTTLGFESPECFPVSARTGVGTAALVEYLATRLGEGPRYFPPGMRSDVDPDTEVAELVREALLARLWEELPHSVTTRVTSREEHRVTVEIAVERSSQKGMVIGKGGQLLKEVGIAVRKQLPAGTYLELIVTVDKDWAHRPQSIERLGL